MGRNPAEIETYLKEFDTDKIISANKRICLWDGSEDEFEEKAKTVGVLRTPNEDIRSLKELVHYGLKGMAAYVEHAHNLGHESSEIFAFMQHALAELTRNDITMEEDEENVA